MADRRGTHDGCRCAQPAHLLITSKRPTQEGCCGIRGGLHVIGLQERRPSLQERRGQGCPSAPPRWVSGAPLRYTAVRTCGETA